MTGMLGIPLAADWARHDLLSLLAKWVDFLASERMPRRLGRRLSTLISVKKLAPPTSGCRYDVEGREGRHQSEMKRWGSPRC